MHGKQSAEQNLGPSLWFQSLRFRVSARVHRRADLNIGDRYNKVNAVTDRIGELLRIAVERGRSVNPKLQLGICGGHGGESESIQFFHSIGLVYVCGSPFRVPRARLSSAHAYLSD